MSVLWGENMFGHISPGKLTQQGTVLLVTDAFKGLNDPVCESMCGTWRAHRGTGRRGKMMLSREEGLEMNQRKPGHAVCLPYLIGL